jgi:hypothetical protein
MAIKSLDKSSLVTPQTTNSMLAGYSFQDYELIESVFVASNTASITFNNLNQYATEYKHLQIRLTGRSTNNATWEVHQIRFNGDSGANYAVHRLRGDGSMSSSGSANTTHIDFDTVGNTAPSGVYGTAIVDMLDAFANKNKTVRIFWGRHNNSDIAVSLTSGHWRNLSAINSIAITCDGGRSFVAGSRFSLYGIR